MLPLYREMTAVMPSLYLTHPSDWNGTDGALLLIELGCLVPPVSADGNCSSVIPVQFPHGVMW